MNEYNKMVDKRDELVTHSSRRLTVVGSSLCELKIFFIKTIGLNYNWLNHLLTGHCCEQKCT